MAEASFTVSLPNSLLKYAYSRKDIQHRVGEWIVISLFSEGHISSGKAANLLEISRIEFIELLNARGVSFIDYSEEEMEEEFAAVKSMKIKKKF